ncbi:hypothetical protein HOE425_330971 [Hoeflea sp. EC-HK425]|nr:hypothetical protein HOE425_330971 [Hoeflea sp. EC-HK425]
MDKIDQRSDGVARASPCTDGAVFTDLPRQLMKRDIYLVLDHCRAVEAAAAHRLAPVDHHHIPRAVTQMFRHKGAADAAADDEHIAGPDWRLLMVSNRNSRCLRPERFVFMEFFLLHQ